MADLLGGVFVGGLEVSELDSPGMGVKVGSGLAFVRDQVLTRMSGPQEVALAAADDTYPRIDLVCVNVDGGLVSSDADSALEGVAGAVPEAPATPEGYVAIAQALVGAAATQILDGDITDVSPRFWSRSPVQPAGVSLADIATDMSGDPNDDELKTKVNGILDALRDAGILDA
jgi:hypothetical protein